MDVKIVEVDGLFIAKRKRIIIGGYKDLLLCIKHEPVGLWEVRSEKVLITSDTYDDCFLMTKSALTYKDHLVHIDVRLRFRSKEPFIYRYIYTHSSKRRYAFSYYEMIGDIDSISDNKDNSINYIDRN